MGTALNAINEERFGSDRFELVSRLADDLAHEIKNPLNAIVINLEVLKVRIDRGDRNAALERAAVIEHEARRLHQLVDRMLQLLRPEPEDANAFALDQVLDELIPLVEARARLARNEFRLNCPAMVFLPAHRTAFKFAVLGLMTSMHERLGEDGGALAVDCSIGTREITIRVHADRTTGAPATDSRSAGRMLETTGALIGACGGTLAVDGDVALMTVPRAPA